MFLLRIKKDLICNGKTPVTIKTLYGQITFQVQRFKDATRPDEKERTYFDLTGQFQEAYISLRLQELSAYYLTFRSFFQAVRDFSGGHG